MAAAHAASDTVRRRTERVVDRAAEQASHQRRQTAQLALATILQAYTGVSDDELIEATVMDRRWQLVLACLDTETAPFRKGTLVTFRNLLNLSARIERHPATDVSEIPHQALDPQARQWGWCQTSP